MANGNVSIQTSGGGSTLGVIAASGYGLSFLNPLYRYANLALPYSPNDPGLSFTYDNSSLAPTVLLYARFFNLLNESSVPLIINVGTSAFSVSGAAVSGAANCLDVRAFGAIGDGIADDTAAIQAALDQAYLNYLGNQSHAGNTSAVQPQLVQSVQGHIENGSGTSLSLLFPLATTLGNKVLVVVTSFDYGSGPSNQTAPTLTDTQGNVYSSFGFSQNGEIVLYLFWANVGTAGATALTVSTSGLRFNSLLAVIAAEFAGLPASMTIDGFAVAQPQPNNFTAATAASYPATGQNDLVISSITNFAAAGVTPTLPPGYTMVGAQVTPLPNALNGSIPVTTMSFSTANGNTPTAPLWGVKAWNGAELLALIRLAPLPVSTSKGFTTVCIPSGVQCMVSPVGLDERLFTSNSCRYGTAAYSLLIQDGVKLLIDGAIVANKNATEAMVSSDHTGDFGWFLVMNKAWVQNGSLLSPVKRTSNLAQILDGLGQVGSSSTPLSFTTNANDFVFYASSSDAAIPPYPAPPSGFSLASGGSAFSFCTGVFAPGTLVSASQSYLPEAGDGRLTALAIMVGFKILPGKVPTITQIAGGSGAWGPGNNPAPFSSTVAIPAGSMLFAYQAITHEFGGSAFQTQSVTDSLGNVYVPVIGGATTTFVSSQWFGAGNRLFVCTNPKAVPAQGINYFFNNDGLVSSSAVVFLVTGVGACGAPISWTDYLAGTAFNEGPRNKNIQITGSGQVVLHGDTQSTVTPAGGGQLFPTGLARLVCADNSSVDSLEIISPFGCALQYLNSTNANIASLFIHDGVNANSSVGAQDPGVIEMDMLRNSTVKYNVVRNCPSCRGILDWTGYQNLISSNMFDTDYSGYEYRDCSGEAGYFFTVGPVTQNSEITQNKAVNNLSAPASAGPFGSMAGSNGFLFYGGYYTQLTRSSVTGVSFHDNIGNNNSTDFSYTTYVSFRSLSANTFTTSSGTSAGGAPVVNSQNLVTGEIPSGATDGVNRLFSLAHIPITSTMVVYLNGLFEVFGTDYTVNGNQITFSVPPNAGGVVSITYQYLSGN